MTGKSIRTGAPRASSSAEARRRSRMSRARTTSVDDTDVPSRSERRSALTIVRTSGARARRHRISYASSRGMPWSRAATASRIAPPSGLASRSAASENARPTLAPARTHAATTSSVSGRARSTARRWVSSRRASVRSGHRHPPAVKMAAAMSQRWPPARAPTLAPARAPTTFRPATASGCFPVRCQRSATCERTDRGNRLPIAAMRVCRRICGRWTPRAATRRRSEVNGVLTTPPCGGSKGSPPLPAFRPRQAAPTRSARGARRGPRRGRQRRARAGRQTAALPPQRR